MAENNRRYIKYIEFDAPVKDPYLSNGSADKNRSMRADDQLSGKLIRQMWFEGGQYWIESIAGPHAGQLIASPMTNVVWARYEDGAQHRVEKPVHQPGKRVARED